MFSKSKHIKKTGMLKFFLLFFILNFKILTHFTFIDLSFSIDKIKFKNNKDIEFKYC